MSTSFDEDLAFVFIYHLLAEWRETRAYRPMARLLRRDPEFVDALMGDGITECVARVMVSLFDGDLEPIVEAALDEDADQFVRGQMLDALVMLALDRPPLRPAVERLPAAVPCGGVRDDAGYRVVVLGLRGRGPRSGGHDAARPAGLRRRADRAVRLGLRGLREKTERDGRDGARVVPRLGKRGPITDTIAELSTWYCFSEAYLEAERNRERHRRCRILSRASCRS